MMGDEQDDPVLRGVIEQGVFIHDFMALTQVLAFRAEWRS